MVSTASKADGQRDDATVRRCDNATTRQRDNATTRQRVARGRDR
ncbi:hypothetical protein BMAPRL20_A2035 [Burkholderia mallei PRL-20]|nr:hypothetical protein BMAPRL20_A2035 [Burkholderia mallei PRL-20]